MVLRARLRRVWSIILVLFPISNLNLDGIIVPFWFVLSRALSESNESDVLDSSDGESCWAVSSGLY